MAMLVFLLRGCGGGGQGYGNPGEPEKTGWQVYGKREKKGRKVGSPSWWEGGEIGKNYANCGLFGNGKMGWPAGAYKNGVGTGVKGF